MASRDYWRRREELNADINRRRQKSYDKQISEIYKYMQDQCQKQINGFYSHYALAEGISIADARKRVNKTDIEAYERKAKKYVRDKDFSERANKEMRLYNATMKINRLELLKAEVGLEMISGFDELNQLTEGILTDNVLREYERQAGILGKSVKNAPNRAKALVDASFHNATYSERIWMYQGMMKAELSKLLEQGLIQGKSSRQLSPHLSKLFGVSKTQAQRLVQTELARVQIEAQKQSFERNNFEMYEYIACHLPDCCPVCKELDGKHFKVKDLMPGENAAPMHPYCHCSVAPWEDSQEYEDWLKHLENGGTTESWKKAKNNAQEELFKSTKLAKDADTKNENSDNMMMYRKGSTHRKTSEDGAQIIDKATYHKITNPAIKAGANIRIANEEWKHHMQKENVTAITIADTIIFREDATVSDVLEEVYHFWQNKKELNIEYNTRDRSLLNEIDAKQYLLSVTKQYHIPETEVELTRRQLQEYQNEVQQLKDKGEWGVGLRWNQEK